MYFHALCAVISLLSVTAQTAVYTHASGSANLETTTCAQLHPTTTLTVTVSVTETVPTPSGFTPILCETAGTFAHPSGRLRAVREADNSNPSIKARGEHSCTRTTTHSVFVDAPSPTLSFQPLDSYTGPFWTLNPTSLGPPLPLSSPMGPAPHVPRAFICPPYSTSTATITESVRAAYTFAACSSANLISRGLNTKSRDHHLVDYSPVGTIRNQTVITPSAEACCETCQTTAYCAWSVWVASEQSDVQGPAEMLPLVNGGAAGGASAGNPLCTMFFQTKCNGGKWLGSKFFNTVSGVTAGIGKGYTFSNGACGQIVYGGKEK